MAQQAARPAFHSPEKCLVPITIDNTTRLVPMLGSPSEDPEGPTSEVYWRGELHRHGVPAAAVARLARTFAAQIRYAFQDERIPSFDPFARRR